MSRGEDNRALRALARDRKWRRAKRRMARRDAELDSAIADMRKLIEGEMTQDDYDAKHPRYSSKVVD